MKKAASFSFDTSREGVEARLEEMGKKLERLRGLYESFFMGVERTPPNFLRRELNRQLMEMQQVPISNSSLRFRYHALSQRWVLLITYWNRTLREIEMGTYGRDVAKAQRHFAQKGTSAITEAEALAMGIPASRVKAFVARQQVVQSRREGQAAQKAGLPTAPAAPGPATPAAPLPGLSETDLEGAYRKFQEAHHSLGSPAPTLEKIRQRLGKQLPQILSDKKCSRVTLEVAVEDGKVRLRARPVQ